MKRKYYFDEDFDIICYETCENGFRELVLTESIKQELYNCEIIPTDEQDLNEIIAVNKKVFNLVIDNIKHHRFNRAKSWYLQCKPKLESLNAAYKDGDYIKVFDIQFKIVCGMVDTFILTGLVGVIVRLAKRSKRKKEMQGDRKADLQRYAEKLVRELNTEWKSIEKAVKEANLIK